MSDTQVLVPDQNSACAANFAHCHVGATPTFPARNFTCAASALTASGTMRFSRETKVSETDQLYTLLCSLNLPLLHLCSALRLRYFTEAAASIFDIKASDLATRPLFLEPIAPSVDLAYVCRSGRPFDRTTSGHLRKNWLCHMLPHAANSGSDRGVIVILVPSIPAVTVVAPVVHLASLTPRQQQIMDLVLSGQPSKNIAADLHIAQRTVENHRAAIMRRTGAKSLPALARIAVGLARSDDCR